MVVSYLMQISNIKVLMFTNNYAHIWSPNIILPSFTNLREYIVSVQQLYVKKYVAEVQEWIHITSRLYWNDNSQI